MEEYKGIYGKGYKDEKGNLYLIKGDFIITRIKNDNGTFDVIIIDSKSEPPFGTLYEEEMSLDYWREFFCRISKEEGLLEKEIVYAEISVYESL